MHNFWGLEKKRMTKSFFIGILFLCLAFLPAYDAQAFFESIPLSKNIEYTSSTLWTGLIDVEVTGNFFNWKRVDLRSESIFGVTEEDWSVRTSSAAVKFAIGLTLWF